MIVLCQLAHAQENKNPSTLSAKDFQQKTKESNAVIIDVRSPGEFNSEHISGASNINVESDQFGEQISKLDRSKSYLVYCGVGKRSALAAELMRSAGFKKVFNLDGGLEAWKKENLPVTK